MFIWLATRQNGVACEGGGLAMKRFKKQFFHFCLTARENSVSQCGLPPKTRKVPTFGAARMS
jgi:hypothetical protein